MRNRKLKPAVKYILYALSALLAGAVLFFCISRFHKEPIKAIPEIQLQYSTENYLQKKPEEKKDEFDPQWSSEDYRHYYDINNDYICQIRFESGIIDLPVVQGYDNYVYLDLNFETKAYDIMGTVYMDIDADTDSENITLYGHYCYPEIDPEQVQMFTPLHLLKDPENYEANKYIDLLFENEARRYQVAAVYYCPLIDNSYTPDNLMYYASEFSPEYFAQYKPAVEEQQFYDSGVDFSEEDNLLTLQTCVANHSELRLIVVAKETERKNIE